MEPELKEEIKRVILGESRWICTTEDLDAAIERVNEYINYFQGEENE